MSDKEVKVKEKKEKKQKGKSYGLHKGRTTVLWLLFISAFAFAVYKNFTGIDRHTVHEKEIIKEVVTDTNGVEKFARDFAGYYFSWDPADTLALKERSEALKQYMTDEIYSYAQSMINETKNTSQVAELDILQVSDMGDSVYRVYMEVVQNITGESGVKKVDQYYQTDVYTDEDGMVVVTLPTLAEAEGFSEYEPESKKEVRELDYKTKEEIQGFLEDFFKVYPVSQETELKYYAKPGTVEVIAQEGIEYQEINEMKVTEYADDTAKVSVKVTYLFQSTQTRQTQQYELTLQKTDNWKIIEVR